MKLISAHWRSHLVDCLRTLGMMMMMMTCLVPRRLHCLWKWMTKNSSSSRLPGKSPLDLDQVVTSWDYSVMKFEKENIYIYFYWLWPSDAIWWDRTWSTLVQIMACDLTAPNHYLKLCWLIVSEILWHSHEGIFTGNTQDIYMYICNWCPSIFIL